jgi:hypothetical protein
LRRGGGASGGAWGFDVVGRLAAADVLCALRGDLVRSG